MFAQIKTNGATHIIINVPHEGAEKSLPALAAMLEKNAVFINAGYSESRIVEPEMSIILGDRVATEYTRNDEIVIKVKDSGEILDDTFVIAEPQVFVSNAKAMKAKDDELSRIRTENSFLKQELQSLKDRFAELTVVEGIEP